MKAMRLTRNEHHRKLRALIRDISDWFVHADASDFCRHLPTYPVWVALTSLVGMHLSY